MQVDDPAEREASLVTVERLLMSIYAITALRYCALNLRSIQDEG